MPGHLPPPKKPDFFKAAFEACWRKRDTVFYLAALPAITFFQKHAMPHINYGTTAFAYAGIREIFRHTGWTWGRPRNMHYGLAAMSVSAAAMSGALIFTLLNPLPKSAPVPLGSIVIPPSMMEALTGLTVAMSYLYMRRANLTPVTLAKLYKDTLFDYDHKNPPGGNSGGGNGGRRLRELLDKLGPKPALSPA